MDPFGLEFHFKLRESGLNILDKLNRKLLLGKEALKGFFEKGVNLGFEQLRQSFERLYEGIKEHARFESLSKTDLIAGTITGGATALALKEVDDASEQIIRRMVQLGYTAKQARESFKEWERFKASAQVYEGFDEALYYLLEYGVGVDRFGKNLDELRQKLGALASLSAKVGTVFMEDSKAVAELNYNLQRAGIDVFDVRGLEQLYSGLLALKKEGFNITFRELSESLRDFQDIALKVSPNVRRDFIFTMATVEAQLQSLFTSMKETGIEDMMKGLIKAEDEAIQRYMTLQAYARMAGVGLRSWEEMRRALLEGSFEEQAKAMNELLIASKEAVKFAERQGPIAMRSMLEQLGLSTEVAIKLVGFDEKEFANRIKRAHKEMERGVAITSAYEEATKSLGYQWSRFTTLVGRFLKSFLVPVLETFVFVLDKVNDVLSFIAGAIDNLPSPLRQATEFLFSMFVVGGLLYGKFVAISRVISLFGKGLGAVIGSVGFLGRVQSALTFIKSLAGFTVIQEIFSFILRALPAVASAIGVIGRVLLFILTKANPVLLVISTIATVGYLVYKNWDKVKAFFSGLWDFLKSVGNEIWSFLSGIIDGLSNLLSRAIDWVKELFSKMLSPLIGIYNKIAGVLNLPKIETSEEQVSTFASSQPSATTITPVITGEGNKTAVLAPDQMNLLITLLSEQNMLLRQIAGSLGKGTVDFNKSDWISDLMGIRRW